MEEMTKIERIREVVRVLLDHGLVDFVRELGLGSFISKEAMESQLEKRMEELDEEELRLLLEDLGPTYIKLGQFLGMRPDLIPPELANELQKLYDEAPPFPAEDSQRIIEEELGQDIDDIFAEFYNKPIAAGSIGQVHEATLKTGEEVVVKVQRPNIRKKVRADMEIIDRIAKMIEDIYPESEMYHPQETMQEFNKMLKREMDYTIEGRNIQRFYMAFKDEETTIVPKVHWEYLTKRVLVMENIQGKSIRLAMDRDYPQELKERMAKKFARSMLKQFFIHGIFHADPSPGNIHFKEDGSIILLDFGAIGRLSDEMREKLIEMFVAMFKEDTEEVMELLIDIGDIHGEFDRQELLWDIENVLMLYKQKPDLMIKEGLNNEIMDIARNHHITLPVDFLLMERALLETEGICKTLDPDFDFFSAAKPVIEQIFMEKYSPQAQIKEIISSVGNYKDFIVNLPERADNVMENIENGDFSVTIEHKGLREMEHQLEVVSNRLSFTIIAAALIIGSALVVLSSGQSLFGPYIFLVAVLIGIWLLMIIVIRGNY